MVTDRVMTSSHRQRYSKLRWTGECCADGLCSRAGL